MRAGDVARYPADHAPFLGVASPAVRVGDAFERLVAPGESVYLLGVAPTMPAGWALQAFRPLAQMVCDAPLASVDGPEIVPLGDAHREDVLELTDAYEAPAAQSIGDLDISPSEPFPAESVFVEEPVAAYAPEPAAAPAPDGPAGAVAVRHLPLE